MKITSLIPLVDLILLNAKLSCKYWLEISQSFEIFPLSILSGSSVVLWKQKVILYLDCNFGSAFTGMWEVQLLRDDHSLVGLELSKSSVCCQTRQITIFNLDIRNYRGVLTAIQHLQSNSEMLVFRSCTHHTRVRISPISGNFRTVKS